MFLKSYDLVCAHPRLIGLLPPPPPPLSPPTLIRGVSFILYRLFELSKTMNEWFSEIFVTIKQSDPLVSSISPPKPHGITPFLSVSGSPRLYLSNGI